MNSAVTCRLLLLSLLLATSGAHATYRHITNATGSDIVAAKDINLRAENVTIGVRLS